jgi:hypothetical protein
VSLPRDYFEDLYRTDPDPWKFRSRWYEDRKRRLTLAALAQPHYASAFEPGCSIGVLTAALATRCDHVLAMDIAEQVVRAEPGSDRGRVEVRRGAVPDDWPTGRFDLVVLSEIGYYLDEAACHRLAEAAVAGGRELIAVHWRHPVADYPLAGDEVHRILAEHADNRGWGRLVDHVEADFRLESWSVDPRSVAGRTGLVP